MIKNKNKNKILKFLNPLRPQNWQNKGRDEKTSLPDSKAVGIIRYCLIKVLMFFQLMLWKGFLYHPPPTHTPIQTHAKCYFKIASLRKQNLPLSLIKDPLCTQYARYYGIQNSSLKDSHFLQSVTAMWSNKVFTYTHAHTHSHARVHTFIYL